MEGPIDYQSSFANVEVQGKITYEGSMNKGDSQQFKIQPQYFHFVDVPEESLWANSTCITD